MRPYKSKKLTEAPDVADIRNEGRASRVGKLPGKGDESRPYSSGEAKKAARRNLKRADRAKIDRQICEDEK